MIPEAILHQIQDRTDLVEIVSAYVPLKRAGRNFKAPCPFHPEKTPSFIVSPDKQIFHCFGCGAGGNVFSFLMKEEKKDFREVVEMLADRVGVEIPKSRAVSTEAEKRSAFFVKANERAAAFYHRMLLEGPEAAAAREYVRGRGLSAETVESFKLGFAPPGWENLLQEIQRDMPQGLLEKSGLFLAKKGGGFYDRFRQRIIFPILDSKGICVAFGARVLDGSLPKYVNSPETEIYSKGRQLYGLFQARKEIREKDSVLVVEGYMDVIACHQAGVQNAVASLGTALTADQARLIKRNTRNVTILYDADAAGELATLRGLEVFLEEDIEVRIVRLPNGHDPDSYIRENGTESFEKEIAGAQSIFDYRLALLKKNYDAGSLEGKVRIANEMVAFLLKVQNEIRRAAWITEMSKQLQLSEDAVYAQMRKGERGARVWAPAGKEVSSKEEVRSVERMLIGLFLDEERFLAEGREEVRVDDFQNVQARRIAKRLLSQDGGAVRAGQLMNEYREDPESVQFISQACASLDEIVDKRKTFLDCLSWVKTARLRAERETLRSQLTAAQQSADRNRINQLIYDLNRINKGMKQIYEKK